MFHRKEIKTPASDTSANPDSEAHSSNAVRYPSSKKAPLSSQRSLTTEGFKALIFILVGIVFGKQACQDCSVDSTLIGRKIAPVDTTKEGLTPDRHPHIMDWKVPNDIQQERHKECDGQKTSSTGGFCLTKTTNVGGNWMVDTSLAEYLRDNVFNGMNVVDLGAGLGHYGKIFTKKGSPVKSWVGYDGAMNVLSATDGLVHFMDLTQPHAADERPCVRGDWVLSLEVAEHIPPEYTDAYIRNLRCHCSVGAVVSWAEPHQTGGLGHVNMKRQEDAVAAMERWGFVVDEEMTKVIQAKATLKHLIRNTIAYRLVDK